MTPKFSSLKHQRVLSRVSRHSLGKPGVREQWRGAFLTLGVSWYCRQGLGQGYKLRGLYGAGGSHTNAADCKVYIFKRKRLNITGRYVMEGTSALESGRGGPSIIITQLTGCLPFDRFLRQHKPQFFSSVKWANTYLSPQGCYKQPTRCLA